MSRFIRPARFSFNSGLGPFLLSSLFPILLLQRSDSPHSSTRFSQSLGLSVNQRSITRSDRHQASGIHSGLSFARHRSAEVISQFDRPTKSLFDPAELGSKAFSYVKRESQFFFHCGARHSTQSIAFFRHFYIRLSIIHRALFVHLRLLPPFDCLVIRDPPYFELFLIKDGGHFKPGTLL
jgi:hypothetical protein